MKHDKKKRRRLEKEPEAKPRPSSLPSRSFRSPTSELCSPNSLESRKIPKLQKRFIVADQKEPSSTLKPSLKRPLPSPSSVVSQAPLSHLQTPRRPLQPQLVSQSQVPTPSLPHPELKVKVQRQAQAQPTSKSQRQVFPTTVFQPQAHPPPDYKLHPIHHIHRIPNSAHYKAPTRNHSDSILPTPSVPTPLPSQPLKPRQDLISNPMSTSQVSTDPLRLLNPLFHDQHVATEIQLHQSRNPQSGSLMNMTKVILTSPTDAVLSKQPRLPGQISLGGGYKPDLF